MSPSLKAGSQDRVRVAAQVDGLLLGAPVPKWRAPSSHTATSEVTRGQPSARTVEIPNSSAARALAGSRPIPWQLRQIT
jgi:hypothetical protein